MASERGRFARWKWKWRCERYGVCFVHGTLMKQGGCYESRWVCETCISENAAKNTHWEMVDHMKRIEIQEQLNKELQLQTGVKEI